METLLRLWAEVSPEAKSFVILTFAGLLGALATTALEHKPVIMPRWRNGALYLGFIGTLMISIVAAHAVDHGFSTALVGAVCGGATLKRLKTEVDRGFDRHGGTGRGGTR
ncbi:MAG: hypothetical protein ACYC63_20520 [Armatimonadota bacterium]